MSDLIGRQAAIEAVSQFFDKAYIEDADIHKNDALYELSLVPSAQPEIIACGDCKYWICHDRRCGYWNHGVKPLDWCSYAERKTDG